MSTSSVLDEQSIDQLRLWLGKRVLFNTLFRLSTDGVNSSTFHAKCDGKGATITIARLPNGATIGGNPFES